MIAHDADITVHNIYIYIIYNNIYICIIYEDDVIYIYNVDGCDILRHQTDGWKPINNEMFATYHFFLKLFGVSVDVPGFAGKH